MNDLEIARFRARSMG